MSKKRYVSTSFWEDSYILDLETNEKLLFIYFITNALTNICWIYEIPIKRMEFDTWLKKDQILKIIDKFSKANKIFYIDWRLYIKNFQKHQNMDNSKIKIWIDNWLQSVPQIIKDKIWAIYDSYISDVWLSNNLDSDLDSDLDLDSDSKSNIVFEKFWNLYNKKINKDKCLLKWNKLKQKDIDQIFIHIPKYLSTIKDKQYQKHPLTYLNNKSREDEIYSAGPDYEVVKDFHEWMQSWKIDIIKQRFATRYGESRRDNYGATKLKWKQSEFYLNI